MKTYEIRDIRWDKEGFLDGENDWYGEEWTDKERWEQIDILPNEWVYKVKNECDCVIKSIDDDLACPHYIYLHELDYLTDHFGMFAIDGDCYEIDDSIPSSKCKCCN